MPAVRGGASAVAFAGCRVRRADRRGLAPAAEGRRYRLSCGLTRTSPPRPRHPSNPQPFDGRRAPAPRSPAHETSFPADPVRRRARRLRLRRRRRTLLFVRIPARHSRRRRADMAPDHLPGPRSTPSRACSRPVQYVVTAANARAGGDWAPHTKSVQLVAPGHHVVREQPSGGAATAHIMEADVAAGKRYYVLLRFIYARGMQLRPIRRTGPSEFSVANKEFARAGCPSRGFVKKTRRRRARPEDRRRLRQRAGRGAGGIGRRSCRRSAPS